jgi:CubicO group peptidase (beta-lactamase class C family)
MAQAGNPTSAETLEALIQEKLETYDVPGLSVAVVKGDRVVWERGFGFADLATCGSR